MIDLTKIKINEMLKNLEDGIEKRFGSQAGYTQVKAVLEGKAETVDTKALIKDSRAVFTGDNKPELLMVNTIENLKGIVDTRTMLIPREIDDRQRIINNMIEKNKATIENRASVITHEVKAKEAMVNGRLVAADGNPVAGAKVIVHGTGRDLSKIIAKAVTDANGEYVIKMDEKTVKESPKKIAITFDSPNGENIAGSNELSLTKGKASIVDIKVAEEKNEVVAPLLKSAEERKNVAMLEMAGLKRSEAELNLLRFRTEKSANVTKAKLDELKNLFMKKDS